MNNSAMNSIPAEYSVLGTMMNFPELCSSVIGIVEAEDFSNHINQSLYKCLVAQAKEGKPTDPITIHQTMDGGCDLGYLMELADKGFAKSSFIEHARIIHDQSYRRSVAAYAQSLTEKALSGSDPETLTLFANKKLSEATSKLRSATNHHTYNSMSDTFVENLLHRAKQADGITGLATGIRGFDKATHGLQPSDLIILGARPSMGKTTLAMNIAEHALQNNERILVFSMEMPADSLLQRSVASIGGIDSESLKTGRLSADEVARLKSALKELKSFDIVIDDRPGHTLASLSSKAHEVHRDSPVSAIVIDYIQLMKYDPGMIRNEGIGEISRGLKSLAKELNVPIIALSQLNRSLEHRPNKRPINSDLRESGSLEQDADLIVFLYRDEVYEPDTADRGLAELIITKQRNGPIGTHLARFEGKYSRFRDCAGQQNRHPEPEGNAGPFQYQSYNIEDDKADPEQVDHSVAAQSQPSLKYEQFVDDGEGLPI